MLHHHRHTGGEALDPVIGGLERPAGAAIAAEQAHLFGLGMFGGG